MGVVPFSRYRRSGNLIFTAGQIHLNAEMKLVGVTIEEKTHQVMRNLQKILEEAGTNFENVVKVTIYVTDMSHYAKINEVYVSYFGEMFPAREVVCVRELPLSAEIEMSVVAEVV